MLEENSSPDPSVIIDIAVSESTKEELKEHSDKERKSSNKKDYVVPIRVLWTEHTAVRYMDDTEDARPESNTPFDPKTRNAFVRLVFMIVFAMILVTMIINLIFRFTPPLARLLTGKSGLIIAIVCIILYFVLTISVASKCAWYPPGNYIILVSSVIVFSIITAYSTVYTKSVVIILAIIATLIVVLICFLIACSSWDFTKFLTYIFVVATAFAAISILITVAMYAFKIKFKPLVLALLVIGVLIQSVVLIVQLQLTLGGKTVATGEEFYIICAFSLYTSIISIFLQLLRFIKLVS